MSLDCVKAQPPANTIPDQPRNTSPDHHQSSAPPAPAIARSTSSISGGTTPAVDRNRSTAADPVSPLIDPFGRSPITAGTSRYASTRCSTFSITRKYSSSNTIDPATFGISAPMPTPNIVIRTDDSTQTSVSVTQPLASGSCPALLVSTTPMPRNSMIARP